ncbi:unnamed protein product [Effrenium voratum]|uniref:very-long-chain 3-oxoacyl-CoA synthase n=1 Tax=Effrenium voratum TaxID=2562239 RepID=A0AA36MMU5_9DINO|nr:unnamed protein product [Effrenium voratum]
MDLQEFEQVKRTISSGSNLGRVDKDVYYWEPKSLRIRTINWSYVFLAEYLPMAYGLAIATVSCLMVSQLYMWRLEDFRRAWHLLQEPLVMQVIGAAALILAYMSQHKPSVYCLENLVYKPPQDWEVSQKQIVKMLEAQHCFNEASIDFQQRILDNSGTGPSTHWPPGILGSRDGNTEAVCNMAAARNEAQEVMFSLVRDLLKRSKVKPQQIDFLIVNCSLFCPTPSLCAMVCNEFGLRQDVRSYNLGGMGCSANVISVDLAKQLLENRPGSRALVISMENITQNLYKGNDKSMLLQNTLFRCGGCALLLSSRVLDSMKAKYKLLYTFRSQLSDDNSYNCVYQKQDSEGNSGVALSKDIVKVAGRALRQNFVQLGPHVLPVREQVKVLCNHFMMRLTTLAKQRAWPLSARLATPEGYTPNFSKGIDHFCIHAGGRAVIEGVQKNLKLTERQIRPSVQTLYDWGNTSSSSIWYETEWIERFGDLHPGERILQISFGSGFKCNSAVWVALRLDRSKQGQPLKPAEVSKHSIHSEKGNAAKDLGGCAEGAAKSLRDTGGKRFQPGGCVGCKSRTGADETSANSVEACTPEQGECYFEAAGGGGVSRPGQQLLVSATGRAPAGDAELGCWAHAALEHLRFPVFGATAGQAGRVNEEQGTANIAWRFAQLGLKEPRTQILVVNAQPLLPELTLQGPANAAQALCEPLPGKKASSRTAADIVLQKLQLSGHGESVSSDEPSAKDILSLSHALTVSGVLSLEAYAEMRRLLRRTAARLDESTFVPLPARSEGEVSWDQPRVLGYLGDGDVAVLWKPPNWTVSLGREDLEPDGAENGAAAGADGGLPLQDWVSATLGVRHAVCKDRSHDYGLAHRLDRFTSGAVLCATSYAGLYLTQLEFATRRVGKIYLALCVGLVRCNRLVEAPLSGGRKADGSWHSYVDTAGRTARTEILEIRLHTGRQHQIRAHLASEGHALVGDSQYGGPVPQWCPRTFLHASRVALEGGEVTCPLPRDLLDALAKLEPCSKACRALKLRAQQEENPVL